MLEVKIKVKNKTKLLLLTFLYIACQHCYYPACLPKFPMHTPGCFKIVGGNGIKRYIYFGAKNEIHTYFFSFAYYP